MARGAGKTICPSEVARALGPAWRELMPAVRQAASELQAQGRLRVTQKGERVDPLRAAGPIRLGMALRGEIGCGEADGSNAQESD